MFLEINAISKRFENNLAVNNVSLGIEQGEVVCLLGPSGCGKTTLLRLIAGLETADSGQINLDAYPIDDVPPHKRGFGMMFQDFALFPHMTVGENIAYGLKVRGDSADKIKARLDKMLELVELDGYENRRIDQLSGGEQQRVALARSLAVEPRLLLLDEPLGALDRALRERLMLDLRTILKRVGVTAVYVTHDQSEAFAIADRVAIMNEGWIEQVGAPTEVYESPKSVFVAQFLGFHNFVEDERGILLIKPDALVAESDMRFEGVVSNLIFRGRYWEMWIDGMHELSLRFETDRGNWVVGERVEFFVDPKKVQLLA